MVGVGIFLDTVIWPGRRDMYRAGERFWARTLMKLAGVKLKVSGQENLPENETVVYMPNHQSDLDWPIIFYAIPGQYLFLAKKELFDVPIFGTYMRLQNYVPIERTKFIGSFRTFQGVVNLIKEGNSIVIYPEGTRSHSEELQRFKLSSFSFLQEARVRVVPVVIDGSIKVQKKGSRLIYPGRVEVKILPPVSFEDIYHLEKKEFCIAASNRVRETLYTALNGETSACLEEQVTLA
jgi:1-acyl-sn-glycerol-3-phosphate acyltransferase